MLTTKEILFFSLILVMLLLKRLVTSDLSKLLGGHETIISIVVSLVVVLILLMAYLQGKVCSARIRFTTRPHPPSYVMAVSIWLSRVPATSFVPSS